jgi:competence protein ComK
MMYMVGYYDRNAKLCTKVTEVDRTLLVDRSPIEILEDSIKCIGFDLRGAKATAKWILGDIHMCPIMINPIHRICLFPNKSPKHHETMWFNPYYILRTSSLHRKTNVEFKNGLMLNLPSTLVSFNHKLKIAEQLTNITVEIAKNPISFIIEPKKDRMLLNR